MCGGLGDAGADGGEREADDRSTSVRPASSSGTAASPWAGRAVSAITSRTGEVPQVGQRARLHDPARADDAHAVAERLDLGQDVAGEQDGADTPGARRLHETREFSAFMQQRWTR